MVSHCNRRLPCRAHRKNRRCRCAFGRNHFRPSGRGNWGSGIRPSSTARQVTYARGLDLSGTLEGAGGIGGLLARYRHTTGSPYGINGASFYHADGNGNVTYLANSAGGTDVAYRYDPFGRWLVGTGSYATANVMRFSSKPWIAHNGSNTDGLYYYGYRLYDPNTQRWLNRDPIGEDGGYNLYRFAGSNPISTVDPIGLWYPGFPGKPTVPTQPPIDCSGYAQLRTAFCEDNCGFVKQDSYPQQAQQICEGFKNIYSQTYSQFSAACVAKCLIKSEKNCQGKYRVCDRRNCCRLLAHLKCYAQCVFIPSKGMPLGAWSFGWTKLRPSCWSLVPDGSSTPNWPPSY